MCLPSKKANKLQKHHLSKFLYVFVNVFTKRLKVHFIEFVCSSQGRPEQTSGTSKSNLAFRIIGENWNIR